VLGSPAVFADAAATVTVAPAAVSLTLGASAKGVVVITNGPNGSAHANARGVAGDPSVQVEMPTSAVTLEASSSVSLDYSVKRISEGSGQDVAVEFIVDLQPDGGAPTAPSQTLVGSLTVKAASGLPLIQVAIEANLDNINENRPGEGVLVVTNLRETPVMIVGFEVSAPTGIDVILTCSDGTQLRTTGGLINEFSQCHETVEGRSQSILRLRFEAPGSLAPGKRIALVRVEARDPSTRVTGSVHASVPFTADVFAESDLLKAVGVPIFLLLPGAVIVMTGWFLISKLSPWKSLTGGSGAKDLWGASVTAVVALAVSLVMAAAYPSLTKTFLPGAERDYLSAYGFQDFYYVLGYSFAIAMMLWAFACLAYLVFPLMRWLFIPWPGDDPRALLRKLAFRGLVSAQTEFPSVVIEEDSTRRNAFKVSRWGLRKQTLVAPLMEVRISGADEQERRTMEKRIRTLTEPPRRPRRLWLMRLWRTIRRARDQGGELLSFKDQSIDTPKLVDKAELTHQAPSPVSLPPGG